MNDLSFLIYLADVAGELDGFFTTVCILSSITACAVLFAAGPMVGETGDRAWAIWRKWALFTPIVAITTFLLSAVVPGKETVYAIAVSEVGEEVLQTETASKATKALNSWLDAQIEKAPVAEEEEEEQD